jgi:integrase
MRRGIDPKATAKGEVTLGQAAAAYLIARPNLAERSKRDYGRVFDVYLADWRDMKLSAITRDVVERRHLELGKERGHATANIVMRTVRAVYNWAIDRYPDIGANPVRLSRQWFKVHRRERHIRADEMARFYQAIMKLESAVARDFLRLLLFTGLRRTEAAGLKWSDIDLEAKTIRLPALRTKAKRKLDLPMSGYVFRLLKARRAIGDAEFVFPANSASGHVEEPKKTFKLVAEACGISISAHDLRRSFSKAAIAAGIHTLHLKALLNHSVGESDVTIGYVSLSTEDLRGPAQKVADQIAKWCKIRYS